MVDSIHERDLGNGRPVIIVRSGNFDSEFLWESVGWYASKVRNTPEAKALFEKAITQIEAAVSVSDAVVRLREVGFDVEYSE